MTDGVAMSARSGLASATLAVSLCLGAAFVVGTPSLVAANELASVTVAQADAMRRDGAPIVDVRRSAEWRETGIVPGSILVTAFDVEGRVNPDFVRSVQQHTDRNQPVLLICRSGNRSAKISAVLQQAGYTHLYNVAGGILAWQSEGLPVEPCTSC